MSDASNIPGGAPPGAVPPGSVPPGRAPARRWLKIALAVSVVLNLLFIGLAAGRIFGPGPFGRAWHLDRAAEALPPAEADEFRAIMRRHRSEMAEQFKAARRAREQVREVLRAEPFDRARLERELAEVRQRSDAMQRSLHAALVEAASRMSPEGRERLSRWERHMRSSRAPRE